MIACSVQVRGYSAAEAELGNNLMDVQVLRTACLMYNTATEMQRSVTQAMQRSVTQTICWQMEEGALQELNLRKQEILAELRNYEKTIDSVR